MGEPSGSTGATGGQEVPDTRAKQKSNKTTPEAKSSKFLETFLAFVGGAAVAIVGAYVQDEIKAAAEAQAWYEEHYIFEGVEPIETYLSMFGTLLREHRFPVDLNKELPKESLVRVEALIDDPVVTESLIFLLAQITIRPEQRDEAHSDEKLAEFIEFMSGTTRALKKDLIKTEIDGKSDIFKINSKVFTKEFVTDLREQFQALKDGPA